MPTIPETQQPTPSTDNATDSGLETIVKLMRKPSPDIDKFEGNELLYRRFVQQFNNYVSAFCDNDHERLTYLGEAHRVGYGLFESGFSCKIRRGHARARRPLR